MKCTFGHFEQPQPMSLDLGIPPLALQQAKQLCQLHFLYTLRIPLHSAFTTIRPQGLKRKLRPKGQPGKPHPEGVWRNGDVGIVPLACSPTSVGVK
jgi:hypothetical protein